MGWNDHYFDRLDSTTSKTTCRCGAVYKIYEDDGTAGCREIETVNCKYCGHELARYFGTCTGELLDSSDVPTVLKKARTEYDKQVEEYIRENGYDWGTEKYHKILNTWHEAINNYFQ